VSRPSTPEEMRALHREGRARQLALADFFE
jgi:hypothetical protein